MSASGPRLTRKLVLHPDAETDVRNARDWYEAQQEHLGVEFLACVERALARVSRQPMLYNTVHEPIRRTKVPRFPFAIYYETEPTQILVWACWHQRRDPAGWQSRTH